MADVYKTCPTFETIRYQLRFVEEKDAKDLLETYADEKAVCHFNSDNCHGDTFYYPTLERMKEAVNYWRWEYERKGFVRWSIIDKKRSKVVGTIEVFHRESSDYFNDCGLLRLDIKYKYEKSDCIHEILSMILIPSYELFGCTMIATKAKPFCTERIQALEKLGFHWRKERLIAQDKKEYDNYWIRRE